MRRHYTRWLLLLGLASSAALFSASSEKTGAEKSAPRVAILAVDADAKTRSLSDLLVAGLSRSAWVELVERDEYDKISKERAIRLLGDKDGMECMRFARSVKADAFAMLYSIPRSKQMFLRLVETKTGFHLGHWVYDATTCADDAGIAAMNKDIAKGLDKLTRKPSERLLVSVVQIRNAAADPWIETEFPQWLELYLSQDPRIFILERRQLSQIWMESGEDPERSQLATANIIVDGEIALDHSASITNTAALPLTFIVRLRNADLTEKTRLTVPGAMGKLDVLVADAGRAICNAIGGVGAHPSAASMREAELFLDLAGKANAVWLADAALALNWTNTAATHDLIRSLIEEGNRPYSYDGGSIGEIMDRANKLARAADMLAGMDPGAIQWDCLNSLRWTKGFLMTLDSKQVRQLRNRTRRLRAYLRAGVDAIPINDNIHIQYYQGMLPLLFENSFDEVVYFQACLDSLFGSPAVSSSEKLATAYTLALTVAEEYKRINYRGGKDWEPWRKLFEQMTRRLEPELQFAAYVRLCLSAPTQERAHYYAGAALDRFDTVLSNKDLMKSALISYALMKHPLPDLLASLLKNCPEKREEIATRQFAFWQRFLTQNEGTLLVRLNPPSYFAFMRPSEALQIIEQIKLSNPTYYEQVLVANVEKERLKYRKQMGLEQVRVPTITTLLSATSVVGWACSSDEKKLYDWSETYEAQHLYLEGTQLWIGLYAPGRIALIGYDLTRGAINYYRGGRVGTENWGRHEVTQFASSDNFVCCYDLSPLWRWKNYICVGMSGLVLFPTDRKDIKYSLDDVRVVSESDNVPVGEIRAVATAGDDFFMATSKSIIRWNSKTKQASYLTDTANTLGSNPMGANVRIDALTVNSSETALFVVPFNNKGPIWRYHLAQNTWSPVVTNIGSFCQVMHTAGRNLLLAERRDRSRGPFIQMCGMFDPDKEQFVLNGQPGFPRNNVPLKGVVDYEMVYYGSNILAICGTKFNGRIVEVHPPVVQPVESNLAMLAGALPENNGPGMAADKISPPLEGPFKMIADGDLDALKRWIEQGGDINACDVQNDNLLTQAARQANSEFTSYLLAKGAKVNAKGAQGFDALTWAGESGNTTNEMLLIGAGADANAVQGDTDRSTPLFRAIAGGHVAAVELLIQYGANISQRNGQYKTPLIEAAMKPNSDVVACLLNHGADARGNNGYEDWGNAALLEACRADQVDNVRLILEAGAEFPDYRNMMKYLICAPRVRVLYLQRIFDAQFPEP
ncbi:MAG: ankyrin repeat domain-containing protein [Patescibacteria group bacterium]